MKMLEKKVEWLMNRMVDLEERIDDLVDDVEMLGRHNDAEFDRIKSKLRRLKVEKDSNDFINNDVEVEEWEKCDGCDSLYENCVCDRCAYCDEVDCNCERCTKCDEKLVECECERCPDCEELIEECDFTDW